LTDSVIAVVVNVALLLVEPWTGVGTKMLVSLCILFFVSVLCCPWERQWVPASVRDHILKVC